MVSQDYRNRDRAMKAPAFQLYAADFYMDTLGWTCEEVGLYFRLLMAEWVNGPLPNDEIRLAKTCQMSAKKFHHNFKNVLPKFVQKGDGYLINQRLEETRLEQQHYQEIQRLKGIKSGESRRKNVNRSSTGVQPKHEPKGNSSSSSSSSNTNNKKNIIGIPPKIEDVRGYCLDRNNRINAEQFFDYYESRGWMIGKNKMKNWQAAIRTWEKNNKDNPVKTTDTEDYIGKAMRGEI